MPLIIPADQYVQKDAVRTAKSVQVCARSGRMAHLVSSNDATATHENTVTARYPTASRLKKRHLVSRPQRAAFHNTLAQKVHMTLQFS